MNINVKRKDCKFIVKPEDRVVICIIESRNDFRIRDLVYDFIMENTGRIDLMPWGTTLDEITMPSTFVGKAVCSKDDEWNEELGRKIAYARAKNKLYTSFFKRANKFVQVMDNDLNKYINKFNALGESLQKNKEKLDADIDSYFEE